MLDELQNATCQRNLLRETKDSQRSLAIHLLGIYNAESAEAFLKSCTVLHDENGQIVITDKVNAREMAVSSNSALDEAILPRSDYASAVGPRASGAHRTPGACGADR